MSVWHKKQNEIYNIDKRQESRKKEMESEKKIQTGTRFQLKKGEMIEMCTMCLRKSGIEKEMAH